jgi:hypothetical protein
MVVAFIVLVVLVFTSLSYRVFKRPPGDIWKSMKWLAAAVTGVFLLAGCASQAPAGPYSTPGSDRGQLQMFQSWARSPTTAAVMVVAFVVLAVLVFTPLSHRVFRHPPGDTWKAVVVVLGVLGAGGWATRSWWFSLLMMVALWACVVWLLVGHLGSAVTEVGRLATELDPQKRAELREEQDAAAERGAALEKVLDEVDEERH